MNNARQIDQPDHQAELRPSSGMETGLVAVPVRDEVKDAPSVMGRRAAMKLMAASTMLASGVIGCRRKPYRQIVSMVDAPEFQKPGLPVYYASTWTMGQVPYGMMVKTVDGRPIKIEGLPNHPLNQGASDAAMQASILSLYDPDRLRGPMKQQQSTTWKQADQEIVELLRQAERVVLITRSTLGPTERSLIGDFLKTFRKGSHYVHETVHDGPRRTAWKEVYGAEGELRVRLDRAKIVLSLDADFLGVDGPVLETTRQFAQRRRLAEGQQKTADLSRLYVVESVMTVTGSNADHRLAMKPSLVGPLARALRLALAGDESPLRDLASAEHVDLPLFEALVKDLAGHRSQAVVLAGPHLPPSVHAAVALLNAELEALPRILQWQPATRLAVDTPDEIVNSIEQSGGVDVLLFMGVDPAYDWPSESFSRLLKLSKCTIGFDLVETETVAGCTYALPSTHNLESWNDAEPIAGIQSLCQPVIAPLFDARQEAESLLAWTRQLAPKEAELDASTDWHAYLRRRWEAQVLPRAQEMEGSKEPWDEALRRGVVRLSESEDGTAPTIVQPAAQELADQGLPVGREGLELVIRPHHALLDGRFAENAWLQELPDPVSKLVWENAAVVGPATARALGVAENDRLTLGDRAQEEGGQETRGSATFPVLVQPGVAEGVVMVTLGHGRQDDRRTAGDRISSGHGVNAAPLMGRSGEPVTPWFSVNLPARKSGAAPADQAARLVRTQKTFSMMDRPIVLQGTAAEYEHDPAFVKHRKHVPPLDQLDQPYDDSQGPKWALAIDQAACTGCSACMIACQAENNIPVVGKQECGHGREMHWIRIDRYESSDEANPEVLHQPMLCQQCDNAPCESVCPVNATAHSDDGLNQQVYNRCVGTRYCANNCPYKVRRFNYFDYIGEAVKEDVQELLFNPQVTVRSRGVMEKCTFCVQRINEGKFHAANAGTPVADGAVRTACQQACPADAIVFGNLNDPDSRVAKLHAESLAYFVLEELNVRPNVAYLARVTNPHPDLTSSREEPHG